MVSKYLTRPGDDDVVVHRLAQDVMRHASGNPTPDVGCTTLQTLHDDAGTDAMNDLLLAERRLLAAPPLQILPQIGMNLARAVGNATTPAQILAYPARMIRDGEQLLAPRAPVLGGSHHLATCLLALRAVQPDIQAMANVFGAPHIRDAAVGLGWQIQTLPPGPDVDARFMAAVDNRTKVYHDPGALGIEPCLYLAGTSAQDVAHHMLQLQEAL